ncbi:MAG: single-stranded DNA-binding protein [Bacteroidales bacterium]|nr:single-stranded DNA-binding protein [Bacteroidales bacterium]
MARGVNKVILIGNLGKDPEVQNFETGKKASFSLATTEVQRDREGNENQHTEWHNVVMWRGLADIAETYLRKGSQVYVEGKIRSRSFDGKDGVKRFVTEIQVDNLVLLGGRKESGNDNSPSGYQQPASSPAVQPPITNAASNPEEKEDLPF